MKLREQIEEGVIIKKEIKTITEQQDRIKTKGNQIPMQETDIQGHERIVAWEILSGKVDARYEI